MIEFKKAKGPSKFGKSLRLAHKDYQLVFCEELTIDGVSCRGLCDLTDKVIYVVQDGDMEATLLHEIFHGLVYESGFKQRNDWDQNMEEALVEVFSQNVVNLFQIKRRK
jgi:hypothetical protein